PAPVESEPDAPLDLSVKPSKKPEPQQPQQQSGAVTETGPSSHRASTGPGQGQGPPPTQASADARAYRRSLDMSDGRGGQYKHPKDYRETMQSGHQPHYLQTLENNVDRMLPHHHRSPYQGQHHPQQQQQQQHPHPHAHA
ncbi:hypothetical protein EGW08_007545, partial [Elysia chlorotica]